MRSQMWGAKTRDIDPSQSRRRRQTLRRNESPRKILRENRDTRAPLISREAAVWNDASAPGGRRVERVAGHKEERQWKANGQGDWGAMKQASDSEVRFEARAAARPERVPRQRQRRRALRAGSSDLRSRRSAEWEKRAPLLKSAPAASPRGAQSHRGHAHPAATPRLFFSRQGAAAHR